MAWRRITFYSPYSNKSEMLVVIIVLDGTNCGQSLPHHHLMSICTLLSPSLPPPLLLSHFFLHVLIVAINFPLCLLSVVCLPACLADHTREPSVSRVRNVVPVVDGSIRASSCEITASGRAVWPLCKTFIQNWSRFTTFCSLLLLQQ